MIGPVHDPHTYMHRCVIRENVSRLPWLLLGIESLQYQEKEFSETRTGGCDIVKSFIFCGITPLGIQSPISPSPVLEEVWLGF